MIDDPSETLAARARGLNRKYAGQGARAILEGAINAEFPRGAISLVSSFGAESAVLLDLVAKIDPALDVVFIDTLKHFPETYAYLDTLRRRFQLTSLRLVRPDPVDLARTDVNGNLHRENPDRCCFTRRVLPLERSLAGKTAWISGRKRFQSAVRSELEVFEAADGRIKVNPLAPWSREALRDYFAARRLPRHPLSAKGFLSIGCAPCTIAADTSGRAGRWAGFGKTECGIHLGVPDAGAAAGLGARETAEKVHETFAASA